jgi:hypothetical protein
LHPVTKSQDAEDRQGPCQKLSAAPVERSQGLLGSDQATPSKESDQDSDAPASGDAAPADTPPCIITATTMSGKKTETGRASCGTSSDLRAISPRASPEATEDVQLDRYRAACFKLLRDKYRSHLAKEGRELAAMRRLFDKRIPIEDIERCWQATLIDPRWDTEALTMAILEEKLVVYRHNPEGYRQSMLNKRRVQLQRDERMKISHGQRNSGSALPSSQRADSDEQQRRRDAARDAQQRKKAGS